MRIILSIILFAVLSLPVNAQSDDLSFSIDETKACLNDAKDQARLDCIGLSSNQCQSSASGSTTVGMGFCLNSELEWWDARLNETYASLVKLEKSDDEEAQREGWNAPKKYPPLQTLQRNWIKYRDALCEYEAVQWGGGTGAGPAFLACMMHETARQTILLQARTTDQ